MRTTQFDVRVIGCELPVDLGSTKVAVASATAGGLPPRIVCRLHPCKSRESGDCRGGGGLPGHLPSARRTPRRVSSEGTLAASAKALRLSWDSDAPFAVDLSGRFPAFAIEARAQKGRRDERLPLTPDFAEWLLDTFPEAERVGLVFKLPRLRDGEPISATKVTVALSKIGEKSRVVVAKDADSGKAKHATAHDLRRSFGTRWAKRVMPAVLQRLMRHQSIGTTMKYYVGIEADDPAADLWAKFQGLGNTLGNTAPAAGEKAGACQETEAGTIPVPAMT